MDKKFSFWDDQFFFSWSGIGEGLLILEAHPTLWIY
jgi:hypothetical protein